MDLRNVDACLPKRLVLTVFSKMDIECEVCHGTQYYVRDGITFCSRCNSESRAHGHETVVDEETIGTFQAGIASALKVKHWS
jgi:hypothetical protein